MMEPLGPKWIGAGVAVGVVVAAFSLTALKVLATPADYEARLAAVEAQTTRAERLAATPGTAGVYGKGAVCDGLSEASFNQVRDALENAGRAEGLQSLQVAWGAPVDAGARIAPLPVSLRVDGPYDKVAGFLDRLGRAAPMVFVDNADLTAASGADVQLSLSGKVFCWTRG